MQALVKDGKTTFKQTDAERKAVARALDFAATCRQFVPLCELAGHATDALTALQAAIDATETEAK